ncbi:MAG: hypothetical protein J2O48_12730 [Solirubrobacterales bacterium]|nr:hypothetical protein [Solirubrobacterales bacterium]
MSSARQLSTGCAAGVAALGLGACGSSKPSASQSAKTGAATIQQAANVSGAAKGVRTAQTITVNTPALGAMTVDAAGKFNAASKQGQINLGIKIPGLKSLGGGRLAKYSNLTSTLDITPGDFYAKVPSELAPVVGKYTGNKPWVKLSLATLGKTTGVPAFGSLLQGSNSTTDPTQALKILDANAKSVKKVGTETIDGVATTHYHAVMDLTKLKGLKPAVKKVLSQELAKAGQNHMTAVPEDVWIDNANLVRRIKSSQTVQSQSGSTPVSMQIDFLAYGAQPTPKLPAASQVFDLGPLLAKYGHQAGGQMSPLGGA